MMKNFNPWMLLPEYNLRLFTWVLVPTMIVKSILKEEYYDE